MKELLELWFPNARAIHGPTTWTGSNHPNYTCYGLVYGNPDVEGALFSEDVLMPPDTKEKDYPVYLHFAKKRLLDRGVEL